MCASIAAGLTVDSIRAMAAFHAGYLHEEGEPALPGEEGGSGLIGSLELKIGK